MANSIGQFIVMKPSLSPLHLPVFTTSDVYLGRVVDVELEIGGERVVHFLVRPPFSLTRLWQHTLCIHIDQVVSLSSERVVVKNNDIPVDVTANRLF